MIFKFICRSYLPVRAEIYMSSTTEENARIEFNKLSFENFEWKEDPVRGTFSTLEIVNEEKSRTDIV